MGFIQVGKYFINLNDISSISIEKREKGGSYISFSIRQGDNYREYRVIVNCPVSKAIDTIRDAITYTDKADCTIAFTEEEVL